MNKDAMFMPDKTTLQPYLKVNYDEDGKGHAWSWDAYLWWDQHSLETQKDAIEISKRLLKTLMIWAESNDRIKAFKNDEYERVRKTEPMHYLGDEIEKSPLLFNVPIYNKIHTLVFKNGLSKEMFDFIFSDAELEFIRMIGSYLVFVYMTRL
jgi:hypothetical protein